MTPEQQCIAIAEACEWEPLPEGHFHPDNPIGQTMPNYIFDLNAMHEVEKVLTSEQVTSYVYLLELMNDQWSTPAFATSSQRAEAFLRTIGKWEEAK